MLQSLQKKFGCGNLWKVLIIFVGAAFTALCASWPEFYSFDVPSAYSSVQKVLRAPVHLADDVMISLRSGYVLLRTGIPAFNQHDIAQPSTSYIAPYLFALLLKFLPENFAVLAYAFLGFLAVVSTVTILCIVSRSVLNAAILSAGLLLTSTNLGFALNGWDHLFQGTCLAGATALVCTRPGRRSTLPLTALCLALGALFRPDGIIICASLLLALYLLTTRKRECLFLAVAPFVLLVCSMLWLNYDQFGHLTPTTSRLKLGAAPTLIYSIKYFLSNAVLSYSALTLFLVLGGVLFVWRKALLSPALQFVLGATALTAVIAAYNSDVFAGARMFWVPACVLAILLAANGPPLLALSKEDGDAGSILNEPCARARPWLSMGCFGVCLVLFGVVTTGLIDRVLKARILAENITSSATAQQFLIAQWIDRNLDPADGAIGLFYLGVAYHLPRFEAADFLGKADEMIAATPVKWGPPGHNKWDFSKTLRKWNPQLIIPAAASDPSLPGRIIWAAGAVSERSDFGFLPALILDKKTEAAYAYCYLPLSEQRVADAFGFFLRRDIVERHKLNLTCVF